MNTKLLFNKELAWNDAVGWKDSLSYRTVTVMSFAVDSFSQFKGRGAWLKCLALFLPLNSGITCTNTLITAVKHISYAMCE